MKLQKVFNWIIEIVQHIEIVYINILFLVFILVLNIFFMGRYWKQLKDYKCMPLAIHITERLYGRKSINKKIEEKIKRLYVCDNWEDKIKKHYYKKISLILSILLIVNVSVGFLLQSKEKKANLINNQYIEKPSYGDSSKKVNLKVKTKDTSGKESTSNINIYVEPNRLNKKEESRLIIDVKEYIRKSVIGKNKIYGQVYSDLNLVSSYKKDSNIRITWSLDEYGLIGTNGNINYDSVKKEELNKGIDIVIVAKIYYFDNEYEYPLYMTVFNKKINKENISVDELKEKINELNGKYNENGILELPKNIGNKKISYSENIEDEKFNNCLIVIIMGVILIYLLCKSMHKELDLKNEKKNTVLIMQYGEILNKIQLFICAGLDITGAWKKICEDYLQEKESSGKDNYAYEEMLYTYRRYSMGLSQREAFMEFGKRIGLSQYIKMSSLILQNMNIGSNGFIDALEIEIKNAQNENREIYIKQGEKLGIKLLFPMMLLMLVTIILVIIPAFLSM